MAVNLFGEDFPQLFGTLGTSLFTLFTIMTLEGWVDGVVRPIMEKFPYAWLFFIPFIIGTTFTVLNLFIGIIVNAMQSEHAQGGRRPSATPSGRSCTARPSPWWPSSRASRRRSPPCARSWASGSRPAGDEDNLRRRSVNSEGKRAGTNRPERRYGIGGMRWYRGMA